ncbi:MAG: DUF6320 domain-containing protein [Eubacteriales bacterium]|nr:DUF6320 domain-containing protein [Eubacteriales bacterium]
MAYCPECHIDIKGQRIYCPLCHAPLEDRDVSSRGENLIRDSYPLIPLRYNQHLLAKVFAALSLGLLLFLWLLSLRRPDLGLSWLHIALALLGFWSLATAVVKKRRNLAKSVLYQLAILSCFSLAWDYLSAWEGWSVTYAIPLLSALALVAILVSMLLVRYQLGDYILYLLATSLLSLLPLLLLAFFQLEPWWPAIASAVAGALVFLLTLGLRYKLIIFELKVRFHI